MAEWLRHRGIFSDTEMVEASVCHQCSDGGFRIDEHAQTTVPGLYAVGECLTGPHGADRRGSYMLGATQVFGARAGRHAARKARNETRIALSPRSADGPIEELRQLRSSQGHVRPAELRRELQESNWRDLLFVRNDHGLGRVIEEAGRIRATLDGDLRVDSSRDLIEAAELKNMLTVTEMVARAARLRQESRGGHYRTDFPERDDGTWLQGITIRRGDGGPELDTVVIDPDWTDRAGDMGEGRWG